MAEPADDEEGPCLFQGELEPIASYEQELVCGVQAGVSRIWGFDWPTGDCCRVSKKPIG